MDGLTGFPEAIEAVYPKAQIQLCIVHMVRNSLRYVGWKARKTVAADLKKIYGAKTIDEAELALASFSEKWDDQYSSISKSWKNKWENITPFFNYSAEIRKAIYTTNAVESINMSNQTKKWSCEHTSFVWSGVKSFTSHQKDISCF